MPRPVACDARLGLAVYEYIEGRKLEAVEIDAPCIDQAAEFILQLNHAWVHEAGRDLPNASEACFSIAEHFAMVDGRIARLESVGKADALDREAHGFAAALAARWELAKAEILRSAQSAGIDPRAALTVRCISPSDFGFQNALATSDRGICFIDFEYAGWDDPAKLVGDFFSHPAVPVDVALDKDGERVEVKVNKIPNDLTISDIGLETISNYSAELKAAHVSVFHGPTGIFELEKFRTSPRLSVVVPRSRIEKNVRSWAWAFSTSPRG